MTPPPQAPAAPEGWGDELLALDVAVYAAIAATPTPRLDRAFRRVSEAANYSRLWLGVSAVLAATGGAAGRRAAADGLAPVGLPSAVVNLGLKPFWARRRPDRAAHRVPLGRHVAMPRSTSFPSGHAASAFAFATGVAADLPVTGIPLGAAAAVVAYSRVPTGLHSPIQVIAGSVTGGALAPVAVSLGRLWRRGR